MASGHVRGIRGLVEVAGARHAVRALAEDTARLTEEGQALSS